KLENAEYKDAQIDRLSWQPLGDMIWGHPGAIKVEGSNMENTLALIESRFENEQVAKTHFDSLNDFEWHAFFEEVFGDG
ncbi:MAG: hypothetical protein NC489_46555, partial [Ruminococcus flavefaciens]|nr:hypothetical protein [Ruminococcus flavefaciens]